MEINLTTPSLLFPTVSLLMLAYTNRFLGLASIVRQLHATYVETHEQTYLSQIENLRRRIRLIRNMQFFGVLSLLLCTVCMFLLFINWQAAATVIFGFSLLAMILSLAISLREIQLSVHALDIHLVSLEKDLAAQRPPDAP